MSLLFPFLTPSSFSELVGVELNSDNDNIELDSDPLPCSWSEHPSLDGNPSSIISIKTIGIRLSTKISIPKFLEFGQLH